MAVLRGSERLVPGVATLVLALALGWNLWVRQTPGAIPASSTDFIAYAIRQLSADHPTWTQAHLSYFERELRAAFSSATRQFTPQEWRTLAEDLKRFSQLTPEYIPFELCEASAVHLGALIRRAQALQPLTPETRQQLLRQQDEILGWLSAELTRRYSGYAREHGVDLHRIVAREVARGRKAMREHASRLLFGGFYRKVLSPKQFERGKSLTPELSATLAAREKHILSAPGPPREKLEKCIRIATACLLTPYRTMTTPARANAIVTRAVARFNRLRSVWGRNFDALVREAASSLILAPVAIAPVGGEAESGR